MPVFSLQKIVVANFRGVRKEIILDFSATPSGLYFIRGENKDDDKLGSNGAGKSSLFTESIIWALTGRISRSQRPGSEVENRQSSGETKVELHFLLDGKLSIVLRTRNPNGLFLNGERVEQSRVDALLPLTDAALRKSILIDQFGEMFLSLRPEAKSQIFTETLNLNRWLRAADAANYQADQTDRLLQSAIAKQQGCIRALAETRDQYELARKGEADFEAEIKTAVRDVRTRREMAKADADKKRALLDNAHQAFSDASGSRIADLNDEKASLRKIQMVYGQLSGRVASVDRELTRFDRQLDSYVGAKVCPECGQKVDEQHLKTKRVALVDQIKEMKQQRGEATGLLEKASRDVADLEKRIAQHEKQATVAMQQQAEAAVAAERSLAADREVNRLTSELAELKQRVNPFADQCDKLETRIAELRSELKGLKASESALAAKLEIYKFWIKGFREIRLEQIDAALLELEMAANRHAETLGLEDWQIVFATERETRKGTVSHGFTVSLYPPGEKEPVPWETYSGGESQSWQLAVTFGLAEVLLGRAGISTDFETLDEPTSHLSPEMIDNLLLCLSDRARELQRRIFLIDHNSLDRGSFDGVITVQKTKERGTFIADDGGVLSAMKSKRERVLL